jgi:hypothetical protein
MLQQESPKKFLKSIYEAPRKSLVLMCKTWVKKRMSHLVITIYQAVAENLSQKIWYPARFPINISVGSVHVSTLLEAGPA